MTFVLVIIGAVLLAGATALAVWRWRRRRGNIKQEPFITQWKDLQKYCAQKETWANAVMASDELLNKALKKRHFKGKSMGERLVSAQHSLSDNDGVWSSHNLSKKLRTASSIRLREKQVKQALINFRQALKDLGALPNDK